MPTNPQKLNFKYFEVFLRPWSLLPQCQYIQESKNPVTAYLAAEQEEQQELKPAETVVIERERLSQEDTDILDPVHSLAAGFLPGVRQISEMP